MPIVQSDNKEVEKELNRLVDLICDGGGGFHSKLMISNRGSDLLVSTTEPMKGKEIIRCSKQVLLSSNHYNMAIKNDEFVVDFPEGNAFTPLQKDLVQCMANVYNLLGKGKVFREETFLLSMQPYPELMDKLNEGREIRVFFGDDEKKMKAGMSEDELAYYLGDAFLKTRVLGYDDVEKNSVFSVLMPVVDFLNHHWCGAGFMVGKSNTPRRGDLSLQAAQPLEDNNECFANYGIMDAFDTFVRYNFADSTVPFMRSIPIKMLEGPEGWKIGVGSSIASRALGQLPQEHRNLRSYMPVMTMDKKKKHFHASHIMIPTNDISPFAMIRVLGLFLGNMLERPVDINTEFQDWFVETEAMIIEHNKKYYAELSDLLTKTINDVPQERAIVLENMRMMIDLQVQKLETYKMVAGKPYNP